MQRKVAVITDLNSVVLSYKEAEARALEYLKDYPDLHYLVIGGAIGNQVGIFNVSLKNRKIVTEFKPEIGLTVDSLLKENLI